MGVLLPYPSSVFVELQRRKKRKAELEEQRKHELEIARIRSKGEKCKNITINNYYNYDSGYYNKIYENCQTKKYNNVVLSKGKRIPCIWEEGGFNGKTGACTLICDMKGKQKKAIFRKTNSQLKEHALIPIRTNDIIIEANYDGNKITIIMYGIKSVSIKAEALDVEVAEINKMENGQWSKNLDSTYNDVIAAAESKVKKLNCDIAYYIKI